MTSGLGNSEDRFPILAGAYISLFIEVVDGDISLLIRLDKLLDLGLLVYYISMKMINMHSQLRTPTSKGKEHIRHE